MVFRRLTFLRLVGSFVRNNNHTNKHFKVRTYVRNTVLVRAAVSTTEKTENNDTDNNNQRQHQHNSLASRGVPKTLGKAEQQSKAPHNRSGTTKHDMIHMTSQDVVGFAQQKRHIKMVQKSPPISRSERKALRYNTRTPVPCTYETLPNRERRHRLRM